MKIKTRPIPKKLELTTEIQELIKEAYSLFDFPVKGRLNLCTPCCISEERMQELITTPIEQLSLPAIYDYTDAVNYDEEGYEIKHFLPRILELIAMGEKIHHSTELFMQRCHFKRPCWTKIELDFMHRFSMEFIKNVLSTGEGYDVDNAMNYILMFDLAGLPTEHLLNIWEDMLSSTLSAFKHFVDFMYYDIDANTNAYKNSFSVNLGFNQQINDWVKNSKLVEKIHSIIEEEYFGNQLLTEVERYELDVLYSRLKIN